MIGDGKCVLVVNEMEAMRRFLAEVLRLEGFTVVQACDGVQALTEMQERHVDVVVTDYHMPHLNGLDLLRQSQMTWPEIPIIFYSKIEWDTCHLTEARGADAWIRESIDPGILLSILALAVEPNMEWEFRHPNAMGCRIGNSIHREKEKQTMATGNADAEEAVLNMLQRYEVLMIEDLMTGRPDFSWAQLFLAVDRLSRKNVIALRRIGLNYQILSTNQELIHDQAHHHEEPVAHH